MCRATCRRLIPICVRRALEPLADSEVDIATLAVKITREAERHDPNVVKAVAAFGPPGKLSGGIARALYFSRATVPTNAGSTSEGPHYHHVGLYAYRRVALERFVKLKPGILEQREKLEQLRALENGMRIDVALVDTPAARCRYSGRTRTGARHAGTGANVMAQT